MDTTKAPVRLAMATVSPTWSPCPWDTRMAFGVRLSAFTGASGLPEMKGSIRIRPLPVSIMKQEWLSQVALTVMESSFGFSGSRTG